MYVQVCIFILLWPHHVEFLTGHSSELNVDPLKSTTAHSRGKFETKLHTERGSRYFGSHKTACHLVFVSDPGQVHFCSKYVVSMEYTPPPTNSSCCIAGRVALPRPSCHNSRLPLVIIRCFGTRRKIYALSVCNILCHAPHHLRCPLPTNSAMQRLPAECKTAFHMHE